MTRLSPALLLCAVLSLLSAAPARAGAGDISVQLLSATVKDKPIDGAEVILQRNGETSLRATSNTSGVATFPRPFGGLDDAGVTLLVKKSGYSNLVVRCPCNGLTYAISPVMAQLDALRVVLNWGSRPEDLDSHLVFPGNHVNFMKQRGADANLDVDDTNGYGPETITLEKKKAGAKYLYAVHNYTDGGRKGTVSLSSDSRAKVFVYTGSSLIRTFTPPRGQVGNVWVVFGIGENGEFYDINRFADIATREEVGTLMSGIIGREGFTSLPVVSSDQKKLADELNRQGEKAYHDQRIEDSVVLYQEAINNNPEHGQAYSNLGLSYQKLNRAAEALWANRKAIAIAAGPNQSTIRASSYYNIARIYEDQRRWQDALESYQQAQAQKERDAYKKGIQRMQQKLTGP